MKIAAANEDFLRAFEIKTELKSIKFLSKQELEQSYK